MSTTSNIAAMQISGSSNTPQSPSSGQSSGSSSKDLLGFLETFLQQLRSTAQAGGAPAAAQNSPQDLNAFAEKIAALLKKDGISADQLQNMSPQDLAAQITKLLQQQNISLPSSLQNISSDDLATKLASLIQQNGGASASSTPNIKPSLTSDLVSPQSHNIQDTQSKEDIAKKISTILEQQQQQSGGAATPLTPVQFHQLETDFAKLQSAPGTVDAATMSQLTTDISSFLTSQGVDQTSIASFLTDLTQSVQQQKDQTTAAADASTTTMPAGTTVQPNAQPQTQQTNADTNSGKNADHSYDTFNNWNMLAPQQQASALQNLSPKNFVTQADKTQPLGGKEIQPLGNATPAQLSNAVSQQQTQSPLPQTGDLTAKITGFSVNPALINDLANSGGNAGSGFNDGTGSQNNNAQQAQDLTGGTTFLQPMTADMLQNQSFTNFMSSAPSGQPSPTTQMVNIQIQNNISSGINSMTLQLEPAELGKMNVKLSFAKDGTVKAHMTVDKPETLALLQKDSSHLQRALQQSGLTTDENSLSFDLRQQSQHQNFNGFNGNGNGGSDEFDTHMDGGLGSALQAQLAIQSSGYITPSGVNIMV